MFMTALVFHQLQPRSLQLPAASKIETGPRIFIISQLLKKSSGIQVYFSYHHAGQLSKIFVPSQLRAVVLEQAV